jgi:hypothetical protein
LSSICIPFLLFPILFLFHHNHIAALLFLLTRILLFILLFLTVLNL